MSAMVVCTNMWIMKATFGSFTIKGGSNGISISRSVLFLKEKTVGAAVRCYQIVPVDPCDVEGNPYCKSGSSASEGSGSSVEEGSGSDSGENGDSTQDADSSMEESRFFAPFLSPLSFNLSPLSYNLSPLSFNLSPIFTIFCANLDNYV